MQRIISKFKLIMVLAIMGTAVSFFLANEMNSYATTSPSTRGRDLKEGWVIDCYSFFTGSEEFEGGKFEYDETGKLVKESKGNYSLGYYIDTEYKYNESGKLEEKTTTTKNGKNAEPEIEVTKYFYEGSTLIKDEQYKNGELIFYADYDDNGKHAVLYNKNNTRDVISEFFYNDEGLLIKQVDYYSGKPVEIIEYYESGIKTKYGSYFTGYTVGGKVKAITKYDYMKGSFQNKKEYNTDGYCIKTYSMDANNNLVGQDIEYEYYENGKVKKEYINGKDTYYEMEYDKYNNVISAKLYYKGEYDDRSETAKYEYDKNGNILSEEWYRGGVKCQCIKYRYFGTDNDISNEEDTNNTETNTDVSNEEDTNNTETEENNNKSYADYGLSDKYVPDGYEDKSGSDMIIEGKNLSWNDANGKSYWYEGGIKQGTYYDPKGVIGDGTNRGREICDNNTLDANNNGTWFWLDSCYDGAKAIGKEVWIPYIYQNEDDWDAEKKREIAFESDAGMGELVLKYMNEKNGKWVRYDDEGRMCKGWVTIEGALAEKYPDQIGNTYYYDTRTGLMAKGKITIDGVEHFFDETTGVKLY